MSSAAICRRCGREQPAPFSPCPVCAGVAADLELERRRVDPSDEQLILDDLAERDIERRLERGDT